MKISTSFYLAKQGIKNITRNNQFSLASVGTIATCIFLIGLFYMLVANFNYIVDNAQEKLSITIFFDEGTTKEQIDEIGEKIKKRAEFAKLEYTSPEEAWEDFQEQYFGEYAYLAEGFKNDNPLANSASYKVYLNDVTMQDSFVAFVEGIEGVRQVNYSSNSADTFTDFGRLISYVSIAIILILLAVGIFLISNTIVIGITVRKEEIGIMKLMGATDFFVKGPFLIEGVVIGLIGAAIPLIFLWLVYRNVVLPITAQFQSLQSIVVFLSTADIFKVLTPMALIIVGGIGFVGSYISIKRHLKV